MNNFWQPMCDATSDYDILYCRLSRDDGENNKESDSISHQKEILVDYAAKNGFDHPVCVVDDGYSGTGWKRPGWEAALAEIESENVRSITAKDKDRF
jgi:DNA invertase Pin-like site-specific DNA recombinase